MFTFFKIEFDCPNTKILILFDVTFCNSKQCTILWITYDFCEPESNNTRTFTDFELFLFVNQTYGGSNTRMQEFSFTDKFLKSFFSFNYVVFYINNTFLYLCILKFYVLT